MSSGAEGRGRDDDVTTRKKDKAEGGLPPSVPGWPLIGNILDVDPSEIHHILSRWSQTHGSIYTVWLLRTPHVVVNSLDTVRQVTARACSRSLRTGHVVASNGGKNIFLGNYTAEWRYIREAAEDGINIHTKEMVNLDKLMDSEVEDFIRVCRALNGASVDLHDSVEETLTSMITSFCIGEKLEKEGEDFKAIVEHVNTYRLVLNADFAPELSLLPFLKYTNLMSMRTIRAIGPQRDAIFDSYIQDLKESYNRDKKTSFVHLLMAFDKASDEQMKIMFTDFLVGGIFSMQTMVTAVVLLLLKYPDAKGKVQQQLDLKVGRTRTPSLKDRSNLPYLQAVVTETVRFMAPAPVVKRVAHEDTKVDGYDIPANTDILMNLWQVMHDGEFWEDPDVWRPERFLDHQGQILAPTHSFMQCVQYAFGGGMRTCLGRQFALDQIFRLVARLLQQFDLRPDAEHPLPEMTAETIKMKARTLTPAFHVKLVPRA